MKPEIAQKWVEALRSGNYTQTTKTLRDDKGYCCLGVLCDLASQEGIGTWQAPDSPPTSASRIYRYVAGYAKYESNSSLIPPRVAKWAEMSEKNTGKNGSKGSFLSDGNWTSLANLNDRGSSFEDIAKVIEKEVETL